MNGNTRILLTAFSTVSFLALSSASSFALGLPDPLHYDMGALGNWDLSGGVSGWGSFWNNNTPASPGGSSGDLNGDISLGNAMAIINKTDGQLQFSVWVGAPVNTLVMGLNSANDGANNGHAVGGVGVGQKLNEFAGSPLFKGYATYQPVPWFSVQAGRLPSPDGTEIGVDWFNPTVWVSDLNNMQTTVADGGQVNFIAPSLNGSTLTVRLADGYKTGHANELGFTGLYNLNADGSDNIVAFGHTRLSTVGSVSGGSSSGTGPVAGFGTVNANLIGIGGVYALGKWTISPEIQYQWLPKNSLSGPNAPTTTYYNIAAQTTVSYQINDSWGVAGQIQYITQHSNSADPNRYAFGDFLGLNGVSSAAPGAIGPGANMLGIQFNPTWQYHNFFVRPAIAYTHLTHFEAGNGYGANGTKPDQFWGLLEVGFLFGQRS